MRRETIHAVIQRDESAYVAECLELAVVTQGGTLDDVVENLRQALALHLEHEDTAALGLAEHPQMELTFHTTIRYRGATVCSLFEGARLSGVP